MFETSNGIDWALLHQQKLVLLQMLEHQPERSPEAETLAGIINLPDFLEDDAAADGRWTFPGDNETEGGA